MAKNVATDTSEEEKLLLAAKVANLVQIERVNLVESSVEYDPFSELSGEVELSNSTEYVVDKERSVVFVKPRFAVVAHVKRGRPLTITADYLLVYSLVSFEEITDEHVDAFAGFNGVYNGWPYWREFVQGMMSRLGVPPLTLPVYRPARCGFMSIAQPVRRHSLTDPRQEKAAKKLSGKATKKKRPKKPVKKKSSPKRKTR